jgi:hypothetical protein
MTIGRSHIYKFYIVTLLTTEFYLVEFFGGSLRIAHFLAPVIALLLFRDIPKLVKSPVFWTLLGFLGANLLASALSPNPRDALFSLGLLAANALITISVALILISGRVKPEELIRLLLYTAIAGIALGIMQVALYKYGGINLALSESQEQQLVGGFASGFRYEANAFAKSLNTVILICIPMMLSRGKGLRRTALGLVLIIGMLISLTRSAIFGLAITLMIAYCWYLFAGRGKLLSLRLVVLFGLGLVAVLGFSSIVGDFNAYAFHKLQLFFDSDELLRGDSSSYRFMGQAMLWDAFTADQRSLLVGNGWGQVKFFAFDRLNQAGGAEIIVALGYGGLLGGLSYLLLHYSAIRSDHFAIRKYPGDVRIPQGVFFAQLGLLVTGQINGSLIAPEYWLLFGASMALAYQARAYQRVPLPRPARQDYIGTHLPRIRTGQ